MKTRSNLVILLSLMLMLTGCSVFSSKKNEEDNEPAKLTRIQDAVKLKRVWSTDIGKGQGRKYNRLRPIINGDNLFVASYDGQVYALDRETGRRIWRTKLDDVNITGGTGYAQGRVLVGTENSEVLALDAENGEVLWQVNVSSEVLSVPAGQAGVVVVQTVDGKIQALDAETGEERWIYENIVPALTLRGTSSPMIVQNFVIAGLGNGAVVSIALDNGTLRWEQRIAVPTGRSEIDRIVDIDGELFQGPNNTIIVPSYKGTLLALDVNTGQPRWGAEVASANGVASGFGNIYSISTNSRVQAHRMNQEDTVWENFDLRLRNLGAPVTFNNYVVTGDFEGYLHLFSQVDGSLAGRQKVDGKGITAPVLSANNTLFVYGDSGKLQAWQLR